MSIVETILVFAAAPAAIVAVIALLIFGPGAARAPRYRPGRDWPHQPVWYAPHPLAVHDSAVHDGTGRTALSAGSPASSSSAEESTAAGGARGMW